MENFYVVFFFIVAIIYNIYKNYKKEMEKSANRQPQQRPVSIPPVVPTYIEKKEKRYNTPQPQIVRNNISIEETPKEVIEIRKRREMETKRKSQIAASEENYSKSDVIDFDLRNAIIQSVILERPYRY